MAALLMKHVERERKKLPTAALPSKSSPVKTFHTQKGQYSVRFSVPAGQYASGRK